MKTLTGKERAKIYRRACREKFSWEERNKFYGLGCCVFLRSAGFDSHYLLQSGNVPPEFDLFRPKNDLAWWWGESDREARYLALLFCEQIALDSKN